LLGYDVREGKLYINEKGAEIVRLIFHKFVVEGKGAYTIAKELNETAIPTFFNQSWHTAVILRILRNEKYCGDLIQRKTYTPNFLEHKKKVNEGQEARITVENHHKGIIDKELFLKAQEELSKRGPSKEAKKKYSNRYCFSGIIKCASCGSSYVARTKKTKEGRVYRYWRCYEAVNHGKSHYDKSERRIGCDNKTISEDILQQILMNLIHNLKFQDLGIIEELYEFCNKNYGYENSGKQLIKLQKKLEQCNTKRRRLIELYLSSEITKTDFDELKQKQEMEIQSLHKEIDEFNQEGGKNIQIEEIGRQRLTETTNDVKQNVAGGIINILSGTDWNDTFYHNILKNVIVYEDGRVEVTMKHLMNKAVYEILS